MTMKPPEYWNRTMKRHPEKYAERRPLHGARIRELRVEKGWTQKQLAERVGIGTTGADVARIEKGNGVPLGDFLKTVNAYAHALDVAALRLVRPPQHLQFGQSWSANG